MRPGIDWFELSIGITSEPCGILVRLASGFGKSGLKHGTSVIALIPDGFGVDMSEYVIPSKTNDVMAASTLSPVIAETGMSYVR